MKIRLPVAVPAGLKHVVPFIILDTKLKQKIGHHRGKQRGKALRENASHTVVCGRAREARESIMLFCLPVIEY